MSFHASRHTPPRPSAYRNRPDVAPFLPRPIGPKPSDMSQGEWDDTLRFIARNSSAQPIWSPQLYQWWQSLNPLEKILYGRVHPNSILTQVHLGFRPRFPNFTDENMRFYREREQNALWRARAQDPRIAQELRLMWALQARLIRELGEDDKG